MMDNDKRVDMICNGRVTATIMLPFLPNEGNTIQLKSGDYIVKEQIITQIEGKNQEEYTLIVEKVKDMRIETMQGTYDPDGGETVDFLPVDWYNSHKKIQRLTSKNGVEVGVSMNEEMAHRGLRQNDILGEEEGVLLVVDILPCEVLVISGEDTALMPKICYEIGNRHAPFFLADNHRDFVTPYDKPIQVMLEKIGAKVTVERLKINLNHNISSSHGGGHSHGHSH